MVPVKESVTLLRSFDNDLINCFSCDWPVRGRAMNGFRTSGVVGEWLLLDSLKKDRLDEVGDTGLLKPSTESTRDNWSVELVLELDRDVVCLDTESCKEYRPLLSEPALCRASDAWSSDSIIRACCIFTFPGQRGHIAFMVRNRDLSCNCFKQLANSAARQTAMHSNDKLRGRKSVNRDVFLLRTLSCPSSSAVPPEAPQELGGLQGS